MTPGIDSMSAHQRPSSSCPRVIGIDSTVSDSIRSSGRFHFPSFPEPPQEAFTSLLPRAPAAVDQNIRPGNKRRLVRAKKHREPSDLLYLPPSGQRDVLYKLRVDLG